MRVREKLKTDLNSAGPLVLKSTYATNKYIQIKNICIYFCVYWTKYPENPEKIGIAKKTAGVGEKRKADLDSAGPL